MKVFLITLLVILSLIILLFIYCASVLAKRADNAHYKDPR